MSSMDSNHKIFHPYPLLLVNHAHRREYVEYLNYVILSFMFEYKHKKVFFPFGCE